MTLQDAEPQVAPDGDAPLPEPDAVTAAAPAAPAEPEALETLPGDGLLDPVAADVPVDPVDTGPTCRACGTALGDGQDWCLECGTALAAPRRLPGLRALGIAGVLTLALTGGAVAASYAALKQEPPPRETKVETVAQTTPAPTTETTPEDVEPLPTVDDTPLPPPAADVTPITPAPVTPVTPVTTTPSGGDTTTTTTTETTPKPEFTRVVLPADAGALYDPAKRATASGDPAKALDGNFGTSWFVTVPEGSDMNVGYLVDLGDPTALKRIDVFTKTPGFTVQVFGATGKAAPEEADSAKWVSLGEAGSVDGDPAEGAAPSVPPLTGDKAGDGRINLPLDEGEAGTEYRWVMVWFTTPPASGPTVRINEFKLYG